MVDGPLDIKLTELSDGGYCLLSGARVWAGTTVLRERARRSKQGYNTWQSRMVERMGLLNFQSKERKRLMRKTLDADDGCSGAR